MGATWSEQIPPRPTLRFRVGSDYLTDALPGTPPSMFRVQDRTGRRLRLLRCSDGRPFDCAIRVDDGVETCRPDRRGGRRLRASSLVEQLTIPTH